MPDMPGLKDIGIIILNENEYGRTNPIIRYDKDDRRLELRLPYESGAIHRRDRRRLASHQDASPRVQGKDRIVTIYREPADMKKADRKRDNAAGTICAVTTDYKTSPVAEKQEAAEFLDPQLSPYRGIRNHEYTKQTAEIKGMLAILALEENVAALQTLGLTEEVEALREANTAFEAAFLAKGLEMNAKSQLSDIDTKTLLNETNALYQEIVKIVNAYAIVDTNAGVREFITKVNGLVGMYANIAGSAQTVGTAPEGDGAEFPDT